MKNILYIDDDEMTLELVQGLLEDDYNVFTFKYPQLALEFYKTNHRYIDIIMSDYVIDKDTDGIQLIKRMQKISRKPSIIVTGYSYKLEDADITLVIPKPFTIEMLKYNLLKVG